MLRIPSLQRQHWDLNKVKIGIIGAGKVGGGFGKLRASAGRKVFFVLPHPDRLKVLFEQAGPGAYSGNVSATYRD
jgi:8-hydroxy-5-deazaflavin:NADPH oxidoreductase